MLCILYCCVRICLDSLCLDYEIMKKSLLLSAALTALCSLGINTAANAVDVTSWSEINDNKNEASIIFQNDITAEGTPKVIGLSSAIGQIINGGGYSLTGANGYKLQISNTDTESGITIQNFGKIVDGTDDNHTYSYTDNAGNTVYKTIQASVNNFTDGAFTFSGSVQKLTVKDTVFSNNTNKILHINFPNGTAFIKDTVFYGNKITTDDNAIITISGGTVSIDNLLFDSNVIENWAVPIDFWGGTHTNITNSIFQNNISDIFGVLQLSGGEVYIDNSQFINNKNKYADGGAITVTSVMQNVTNSLFKQNTAAGDGGAIWYAQLASSPYIIDTKFEENKANGAGGAIYIGGTSISTGTVYLINSDFKGNEGSYGGGIYSYDSTDFYVVDTDFTGNIAKEGGAIYAQKENLNIFANTKDVYFKENIAQNETGTYNAGAAIYYDVQNKTGVAFNINAGDDRKVVFDNSIAAYGDGVDVNMNINKSGLSYNDIDGNPVTITNTGEIQFNSRVGDADNYFSAINLYGGKLSIGQNADNNANVTNPDGYINDNNFYVKGDSILNTVNGLIGEFAPREFIIDDGVSLDYMFDVDLANTTSDKIANLTNNGKFNLSSFNVISDTTEKETKVKYSDTNVEGILKDDYTITTSTKTYELVAENDTTGSYIVFKTESGGGGLPSAIINGSDQYVITDGQDENIPAWDDAVGNVITKDMDINGNGQAIYTENGIDGMVVSDGKSVQIRNVSHLSGFNVALTNGNGTLSIIDTDVTDNTGEADVKK